MGSIQDRAERDAQSLLETVWQQGAPAIPLPVDPAQIAHRLGIDVLEANLDPNVSGALVKERDHDPTILLNAIDSDGRKRFSCAHEIGHFVLRSDEPESYEYVDWRDERAKAGTEEEEVYANAFAASLLMPRAAVRKVYRDGMTDVEMAWYFDVSREAMSIRLDNLGYRRGRRANG